MFIRLKKRKPSQTGITYSIVAVESFWDKQKKPRQKFIKHLGSIKESELLKSSAYNEYINDIMKYIRCDKGYVMDMGEKLITQEEFKKLIHTSFTKVGTRIMNSKA